MYANGRNPPLGMRLARGGHRDILWAVLPFVLGVPVLLGVMVWTLPSAPLRWQQAMFWFGAVAFAALAVIAAGEFCGRHGIARQIQQQDGELDNLRRQLWRSEQRFEAVLNQSAIGIAVAGMDGRILTVNQRLCAMLGYTCEQLRYRSYREITDADDLSTEDPQAQRLIRGDIDSYDMEKRLLRRDGSPVWVHLTCSAVRGDVDYVVAIIEDISERHRALDGLRASEARLAEAKEVAEAANRAKDQFLAVLSHELRTPLTPVLATASSLQHEPIASEETRESLAMICRNVELEARLIDDLLDLTRLTRGKLELRPQPVQVAIVIRHTVEICANEAAAKRQQLHVNLGEAGWWLHADPPRLQQVFWNLLNNAIKFTPAGGRIEIRAISGGDGQDHVTVEVTDTGVGIAPEVLPRIFGAFEQGSRLVTRKFGGLGLGLAISKAVVEMHGGTISAHSDGVGKGAAFRVVLPTTSPPAPQAQPPAHAAEPEERPARILLVEDHADTAKVMCRLLQASGHTVRVADSVASAFEAATRERFDLIISDLGLPDGSGLELLRRLREGQNGIRAIALSGFGMDEDVAQSRSVGFVEHLTKPVSIGQLEAAIARVLG